MALCGRAGQARALRGQGKIESDEPLCGVTGSREPGMTTQPTRSEVSSGPGTAVGALPPGLLVKAFCQAPLLEPLSVTGQLPPSLLSGRHSHQESAILHGLPWPALGRHGSTGIGLLSPQPPTAPLPPGSHPARSEAPWRLGTHDGMASGADLHMVSHPQPQTL